MRIDFSCNREKSLHMYNSFFLKLSENILSYKKPKKKTRTTTTTTTQTQKTPKKDTEKS